MGHAEHGSATAKARERTSGVKHGSVQERHASMVEERWRKGRLTCWRITHLNP